MKSCDGVMGGSSKRSDLCIFVACIGRSGMKVCLEIDTSI
jgi:hypothetical protein